MDAVLTFLAYSLAPMFFLVMAIICVVRIIRLRNLRGGAATMTNGIIKDIAAKHKRFSTRHHYQATLVFTTECGQRLILLLMHQLEAVDFFAKHIGKTVEVTVFYNPRNPRRYYVKEITLPIWRYYVIAAILACCAMCFGWMMYFMF